MSLTAVSLLDVVGRDTTLRRKATTKGGEYHGPCPFCGGKDRFMVWPNAERPGWHCRQCGKGGDAIGYVMERDHVDFKEACEKLKVELPQRTGQRREPKPDNTADLREFQPRPAEWQSGVMRFVARAEEVLWSDAGAWARDYLTGERGLTEQTIRIFRLGYCPKDDDGHRFYQGVTIPWIVGEEITAVNIRRKTDDQGEKYRNYKDGTWSIFGQNSGKPTLWITEGEFDAMLLWQAIGDVADVMTLGGAGNRMSRQFLPLIDGVERLWIVTDRDEAGDKAAEYWKKLAGRSRRVEPPDGKDLTDAHRAGVDLRAWAMNIMGLDAPLEPEPERTPPDIINLWCRDETERQAVMTYLNTEGRPAKPAELIEAERRICEAYYGKAGYDAELAALTERITKGEAHCAANPGDLKSKRLLSELKVKLDKLHEVKVMAALKEYERVSDACGGSWQWPLEAETNAVMDAARTTNR